LDCVLNQTFADWEAICVNDGSPDNSAEILDEYAARDSRFKVITQKNGGLSDARNTGMRAARGEFVLFLDSDDFIHPQTMEITHALAMRFGSDIVSFRKDLSVRTRLVVKQFFGGDTDRINPPGMRKRYDLNHVRTKTTDDIFPYVTERSHRPKYMQIKHAYVWQNLYRRELIKDIPFYKGIIMEDFAWWPLVWLKHPRVTITRLPFYYYIPQLNSIMASSKRIRKIGDIATGMKHVYNIYKKQAPAREMNIWQKEFLWPYVIWCFRDAERLDNEGDLNKARDIFKELSALGIFDNPPNGKARRYRAKISDFIK
jgi:glycosyltransferase involved in cell wall biosynthesis